MFAPGQRWFSVAEPELGLGTVLRADARQVQIVFARSGVVRLYAQGSAPLARAAFAAGDRVLVGGVLFPIDAVDERAPVLRYHGGGRWIDEGALDDVQNLARAGDRLVAGRVDPVEVFELRRRALARRAQVRTDPAHGLHAARIDLVPHQLRVAENALARRPPRVLLADEVGLGKTIEAGIILARLLATGRATRALVLVPEALVFQWYVELKRRFNLDFAIYDAERALGADSGGTGNPFAEVQCVISDPGFLVDEPVRAKQAVTAGWDVLVVDEAHHLEWAPGEESPEYVLVEALARRIPALVLLTATPEQLGRTGHFARLRLLDPARFHDLDTFRVESERYTALSRLAATLLEAEPLPAPARAALEQVFADEPSTRALLSAPDEAPHREALLSQLVDRHGTGRVMFRNRRVAVGGFPRRLPQVQRFPASDACTVAWRAEFEHDLAAHHALRHVETEAEDVEIPRYDYRDDPRLAWLVGLLEAHPQSKFLLILHTLPKLLALDEALRLRSGVPLARFHEGLTLLQRDRAAAHFADREGARLLLSTEIGSEGRNFQFAQHLVLWDLPLDPDLLEQRIGRLDRIGQRGDVHVHVAAMAGTAQDAVLRWYVDALDALRTSPEDGRELYRRFGERLTATARALADATPGAEAALEALIEETRAVHAELAARIAEGRDRLLEIASRRPSGGADLLAALAAGDADREADEFATALLEHFGVDVDEAGPRIVRLDPEMATTEALPGLARGPRLATFDRATALAREELSFLRLDHPLLVGALDLMLGSEAGNAAFLVDETQPARTAVLEACFVVECVAPASLGLDRFLAPEPLEVAVDSRLAPREGFAPDARAVAKASDRAVDVPAYRKILARLVPPMLEAAERRARDAAAQMAARAGRAARAALGAEIDRLRALARVNPAVRAEEIDAAQAELAAILEALPGTRPRLDALRLVVSADFLALRG